MSNLSHNDAKKKTINKLCIYDFLLVGILLPFFSLFYFYIQPQIIAGGGYGWDGIDYYHLFLNFLNSNNEFQVPYPVCKRLALPFLASLTPLSPEKSFLFLNLLSGFFAAAISFFAIRLRFNSFLSFISILPLIFYFFSPLRFSHFHPFYVDPPVILFFSVSLFFLIKEKYFFAFLALLICTLFREPSIYFALSLVITLFFKREISSKNLLIYLLLIVVFSLFLSLFVHEQCNGSQIRTFFVFLYKSFSSFYGVIKIIAAILMTIGPFVIIKNSFIFKEKDSIFFVSLVWFILALLMAIFGGGDTTRVFYSAYPLYVLTLLSLIVNELKIKILVAAFLGLVSNSFLIRISEPEFYWPTGSDSSGFWTLFPDYSLSTATSIITFWLFFWLCFKIINWNKLNISCINLYMIVTEHKKTVFWFSLLSIYLFYVLIFPVLKLEIANI